MRFLKWLLNIGLITLITRTVSCIDNNLEIIDRLPDNIIPVHYNIKFTPYLEGNDFFIFYGESIVKIVIRYVTSKISLHSRGLEINKGATRLMKDSTIYDPLKHTYNNETNILTIHFDDTLLPGFYILQMKFTGNLLDPESQTGFMKFPYKNDKKDNEYRWLAVTQFEPNGARQMFPCWDEPALKATFDISLIHNEKYRALSNMPIRKQFLSEEDGMMRTYFYTTPIMSTYIVAIVMTTDFMSFTNENETISMWCKPSLISKVKFAHDIAEKVVEFLIQYTNSSQKVSKMDHFLIPNFVVGGMENWGLITYDQSRIIYDDSRDPIQKKTKIAFLVAHELAHQWFGNLVTPSWWSYLWLSKGFAMFFETYIINQIFEDWRAMDLYVFQRIQQVLYKDVDMYSVTLNLNNKTNLEDLWLFYKEIYEKASLLLRMLHSTVTDEVFRKGLITYLTTHQFRSVTPDDLWSAMQSALDKSNVPHEDYKIKEVMDTWMNQERHPIVNVVRNYETGEVTISQICVQRHDETENKTTKWWIPVTYATQSNLNFFNTVPRYWLRPDQHNITFTINPNDWIIVNLQQTGYYRVDYDVQNWQKISRYLNSNEYRKIHVLNRAQIISDSVFMIIYNQINGHLFIENITSYLFRERDYVPWQPLFVMIENLSETLFLLPEFEFIKIRFEQLLNKLLQYVGYVDNPNDDDIAKQTRLSALKWACIIGDKECKRITALKLSEHLANPKTHKLSQDEIFMYCTGMMAANRTTWNRMFALYLKKDRKKQEKFKKRLLRDLSCAENPDIIIYYLNIIFNGLTKNDDKILRKKEYALVFKYIVEKHASNDTVFDYILNNFEEMYPISFNPTGTINLILNKLRSNEQIDKVMKKLLETHFSPGVKLKIIKMIEKSKESLARNVDHFKKLFFKRYEDFHPTSDPTSDH